MYARQRVLLDFLLQASRRPGKLELVKWLFLARHESDVANRVAFYDFLPYQYGPFSFTVYKDLAALRDEGYLADKVLKVLPEAREEAEDEVAGLTRRVRDCVSSTLDRYGGLRRDELLRVVYDRYPWYASRSQLVSHDDVEEAAEVAVYTVGYEGRSVDAFLDHLLRSGIKRVIDVRRNPFSRKYGFTRRALDNLCAKADIDYAHFPQVGVPSRLRTDLSTEKAYRALFRHYEKEILPEQNDAVAEIGELMEESQPAIGRDGLPPLEAQRLGLEAYASDLNPVAVLINKAMIEIPPKFAGKPPVNPESFQALLWAVYVLVAALRRRLASLNGYSRRERGGFATWRICNVADLPPSWSYLPAAPDGDGRLGPVAARCRVLRLGSRPRLEFERFSRLQSPGKQAFRCCSSSQ